MLNFTVVENTGNAARISKYSIAQITDNGLITVAHIPDNLYDPKDFADGLIQCTLIGQDFAVGKGKQIFPNELIQ